MKTMTMKCDFEGCESKVEHDANNWEDARGWFNLTFQARSLIRGEINICPNHVESALKALGYKGSDEELKSISNMHGNRIA